VREVEVQRRAGRIDLGRPFGLTPAYHVGEHPARGRPARGPCDGRAGTSDGRHRTGSDRTARSSGSSQSSRRVACRIAEQGRFRVPDAHVVHSRHDGSSAIAMYVRFPATASSPVPSPRVCFPVKALCRRHGRRTIRSLRRLDVASGCVLGYSIRALSGDDPKATRITSSPAALFVVNAMTFRARQEDGGTPPAWVADQSRRAQRAL
jgi:hypothetical protein